MLKPHHGFDGLCPENKALKRTHAGDGKPWCPTARGQGVGNRNRPEAGGRLRSGKFVSAAEWESTRHGLAGSKPSSGWNPEGGSIRAAGLGADRPDLKRCGDAKPQESHRGRTQPARRPGAQTRRTTPRLRGRAIRESVARVHRRSSRNPFRDVCDRMDGRRVLDSKNRTTVLLPNP